MLSEVLTFLFSGLGLCIFAVLVAALLYWLKL